MADSYYETRAKEADERGDAKVAARYRARDLAVHSCAPSQLDERVIQTGDVES